MNNMMPMNPNEFQPVGVGNSAMQPPPPMMNQQPQAQGRGKQWALMQALNQNKGGGIAGMIPQLAGAYMMSKGGFGG